MVSLHPHWELIYALEAEDTPTTLAAAELIRELKADLAQSEERISRERWPDTTGQ